MAPHPSSCMPLCCADSLRGGGGSAGPPGGAEGVVRGAELLRRQGGHGHLSLEVDIKTPPLHPGADSKEQAAHCRVERNHKQRKKERFCLFRSVICDGDNAWKNSLVTFVFKRKVSILLLKCSVLFCSSPQVEKASVVSEQVEAELPVSWGRRTSTEELQDLLQSWEQYQDRLDCEHRALSALELRAARLLGVPAHLEQAPPTPLCQRLQTLHARYNRSGGGPCSAQNLLLTTGSIFIQ